MTTEKQIQALKLVRGTRGMNLTHRGNVLVSAQAKGLLSAGLIDYGNGSAAYRITPAGERVLAAHCQHAGCFAVLGACGH